MGVGTNMLILIFHSRVKEVTQVGLHTQHLTVTVFEVQWLLSHELGPRLSPFFHCRATKEALWLPHLASNCLWLSPNPHLHAEHQYSHPTPSSFSPHTANTWGIYTGWCIPCHQHTLPDHRSESSNKLNNHLVPRAVCFTHHQDGYLSASLAARGPASEIPLHPLAFLAYIHAQRLGSLEDVKMKFRVQIFFRDEYLWKDEGQK